MNQLISYDEAMGILLMPSFQMITHPDFTIVRALCKYINLALAKLERPQSLIYGWTGMAMDPTMYSLIKTNPFVAPPDPGPTTVYNGGFQTPQQMKVTKQIWSNDKTYFLSYGNIHCACFWLLNKLVRPEFKVSNIPSLTGWNSKITIHNILSQLELNYSKPTANIIWNNNVTFTSSFSPVDTPKSLFCRIEEWQEIAILWATPYTVPQIVNNTIHLFLQSGIILAREFESWDAITP